MSTGYRLVELRIPNHSTHRHCGVTNLLKREARPDERVVSGLIPERAVCRRIRNHCDIFVAEIEASSLDNCNGRIMQKQCVPS